MCLELIAAGKLLDMALGGIVGNAATEGAKLLWRTIRNRLVQNQPTIEAEIIELEQNPIPENLQPLEAFLQVEMHKDQTFAEAISKLGQEIANASSGDNITVTEIKAEGNAVAAAKIDAPGGRIGGSDTNINVGKD